ARLEDRLAARLVGGLAAHGHAATSRVDAVPGARSAGLAAQVDAGLPWAPDVALVVVGANDLTHLVPVDAAVRDLAHAVRRLRAGGAEVVVAPAPDLSAVPHVPVFLREVVRAAGEQLRARQASAVVAEGGLVADRDQVASRAFATDATLFSADRFHPSSRGYAVIADALLPTVLDAVRAVEAAS
ncbi:GDSL-type esterase/lipase family protein, partial [Nocardioides sp.]|uniref:GDSL-type esterase/lipase family protein n=1 Tax=Nocardioides sp. TaxID=35761 RepID=UPI0027266452